VNGLERLYGDVLEAGPVETFQPAQDVRTAHEHDGTSLSSAARTNRVCGGPSVRGRALWSAGCSQPKEVRDQVAQITSA
jgi:hypothetical protein